MSAGPLQGVRVLMLTTTLNPGGVVSSLKALLSVLLDLGSSVKVAALESGGAFEEWLRERGLPVEVLGVKKWWYLPGTTQAVRELIRREAPTVVHAHCYEPDFHACRARASVAIPWLFITHHDPRMRLHRVATNCLTRNVPDRIVMVSQGLRDLYRKWCRYPEGSLFVLPNAVNLERFRPAPRDEALAAELGLADARPIIGNVGGFGRPKGQPVLVQAFAQVLRELPQARLVLVGEGKHRPRAEALAEKLGVADRVLFAGHRSDVPRLLSVFDVYVQPSWMEADPVAVKEAMATGKPVVSTATIGPRGFIEHGKTGLLVPVGDARGLAEAIVQVARDPHLAERLGAEARRYAEVEFSHETYRRRVEELYRPVIENPQGRGR
ncbi:MAG: glycosyltransferase [Armatimonadetes bacterium]|nr:glycosyltransferase [Armatimonadota bacterium]